MNKRAKIVSLGSFAVMLSTIFLVACGQDVQAPQADKTVSVVETPDTNATEPGIGETSVSPVVTEDAKPAILVFGITGKQGGAVARELLDRGYPVTGISRDPEGESARRIARELEIRIVSADLEDMGSMQKAMQGIYGVFFITPNGSDEGQLTRNLIAAALENQVQHVIYSSYLSTDPERGYPGPLPKKEAEGALRDSGLGYTIFRPVSFMENWLYIKDEIATKGLLGPNNPESKGQFISVVDIAWFVGEAFDHPDEWLGKEEGITGEEIAYGDLAKLFGKVMGREVRYIQIPWSAMLERLPTTVTVDVFKWAEETGGARIDMAAYQQQYPTRTTVEDFLRANGFENYSPEP